MDFNQVTLIITLMVAGIFLSVVLYKTLFKNDSK